MSWQRARSDEQKAERAALLEATALAMLEEGVDPMALSLNELARRAGMSKSNVYRYFESREAILLSILGDGAFVWSDLVAERMARISPTAPLDERVALAAEAFTAASSARPVYGDLLAVLPLVLERNASTETIRAFKTQAMAGFAEMGQAIGACLPELGPQGVSELVHLLVKLFVGLWPLSHPPQAALEAMDTPELCGMRYEFGPHMSRAFEVMARGILACQAGSAPHSAQSPK